MIQDTKQFINNLYHGRKLL